MSNPTNKLVEKDHWITVHPNDAHPGTHILIDGSGKVTGGPAALRGKPIDHLSDKNPKESSSKPSNKLGGKVGKPKTDADKPKNRLAEADARQVAADRAADRQSLIDQDRDVTQTDRSREHDRGVDEPNNEPPSEWETPESGWDIPEADLLAEEGENQDAKPEYTEPEAEQQAAGAGDVGPAGGSDGAVDAEDRGDLAPATGGPDDQATSEAGSNDNKPAGEELAADLPGEDKRKAVKAVIKKINRYRDLFRKKGMEDQAEWMDELKEHVKTVGIEGALEALGPEKVGSDERVQYVGGDEDLADNDKDSKFVRDYLDQAGITLVHSTSTIDPNSPVVSSFSRRNLQALGREVPETPGGYIPTDQTLANKLEESKLLPGLESSEDINTVNGAPVTHFTKEVMAKFDEKYGKGQWIVKSYGAEAYAGFGIFFPQRVKQIQADARASLLEAKGELSQRGYKLVKDDSGKVTGVVKDGQKFSVGTPEYLGLSQKVQRLGKQAVQGSHGADGAKLPQAPEDALQNDYGMSFRRNGDGKPIGITDRDGRDYDFDSEKYKKYMEKDEDGSLEYAIHRAQESDEWRKQGFQSDPRFMVQPAFKAVGVSDYDRAMGMTWETSTEGRVHCTTKDGKATAIPYATLAGRHDSLPAVFQSEDIKGMEKAVEDAINRLPESERAGQLYAPDVMKTKDGWRVVELNPSAEGGGSSWLGGNPFVMDALASQVTGREPQHVRFIRGLLSGKGVKPSRIPAAQGKPQTAPNEPAEQPRSAEEDPSQWEAPEGGWELLEDDVMAEEGNEGQQARHGKNDGFSDAIEGKAPPVVDLDKFKVGENIGASEHNVYHDPKTNRYYKMPIENEGKPYLERHQILNEVWPDLGYKLEGVGKDGTPVISMNALDGKKPSRSDVQDYLKDNGWRPAKNKLGLDLGDTFHNDKLGVTISDAKRPDNWIKTDDGKMLPIDVDARKESAPTKAIGIYRQVTKASGPCKPGQTAGETGCTPVSGSGSPKNRLSTGDKNSALPSSKTGLDRSGHEYPLDVPSSGYGDPYDDTHYHGWDRAHYLLSEAPQEWKEALDKRQILAIRQYTAGQQENFLNDALRDGVDLSPKQQEQVSAIDTALVLFQSPANIILFRGLEKDPGLEVGETYLDVAYSSTSTNSSRAEEYATSRAVLSIKVPKGSNIGPLGKTLSRNPRGEDEVLLPRNSKYKIDRITLHSRWEEPYKVYHVTLVVKQDEQVKRVRREIVEKASGPCKPGQTASSTGCVPLNRLGVGWPKTIRSTSAHKVPADQPAVTYAARLGRLESRYSIHADKRIDGPNIPLKNYVQRDQHSCGFVAALTISRLFDPHMTAKKVLSVVRPSKSGGVDGGSLMAALAQLGIKTTFRRDLTIGTLKSLVARGTPVLITVYPKDWSSDHWTVVQGFDSEKIYLTNYKSLPVAQFKQQWFDRGEGIVCEPKERATAKPVEQVKAGTPIPSYMRPAEPQIHYRNGKYYLVNGFGREQGFASREEAEEAAKMPPKSLKQLGGTVTKDDHWITLKPSGTHVMIGEGGKVYGGPAALTDKPVDNLSSSKKPSSDKTDGPENKLAEPFWSPFSRKPASQEKPAEAEESSPIEQHPKLESGAFVNTDTIADRLKSAKSPVAKVKEMQKMMDEAGEDVGDVSVHGMSKPEKMRKMSVGFMQVMWPADHKGAAESLATLMEADLPDMLSNATKKLVFASGKSKDDEHWAKTYGIENFNSAATGGDGTICVYNGAGMSVATFCHESGHNLAAIVFDGSTKPPTDSAFGKTQEVDTDGRVINAVSKYGSNSTAEDFAEACSQYGSSAESKVSLQKSHPDKYAALEGLLNKKKKRKPVHESGK